MKLNSVYIANILGLVILACTAVCNSAFMVRRGRGFPEWRAMMLVSTVSFLVEPLMYKLDGVKGDAVRMGLQLGNTWLFLAGALLTALWLRFFTIKTYGSANAFGVNKFFYWYAGVCAVSLAVNLFYPMFFYIDHLNNFQRGMLYVTAAVVTALPAAFSVVMYIVSSVKYNKPRFYDVIFFLLPVGGAYLVQFLFDGVSVTWCFVAVGLMCVTYSIQNEERYRDSLTGLYNRAYLDHLVNTSLSQRNAVYDGIMIDINSFKSINDNYGHAKGDEALRLTSRALEFACGANCIIIRYAGDEFVVLIPSARGGDPQQTIDRINECIERIGSEYHTDYVLSISCGHGKLNASKETVEEFMNRMDMAMFVTKRAFYELHPDLERRRH